MKSWGIVKVGAELMKPTHIPTTCSYMCVYTKTQAQTYPVVRTHKPGDPEGFWKSEITLEHIWPHHRVSACMLLGGPRPAQLAPVNRTTAFSKDSPLDLQHLLWEANRDMPTVSRPAAPSNPSEAILLLYFLAQHMATRGTSSRYCTYAWCKSNTRFYSETELCA